MQWNNILVKYKYVSYYTPAQLKLFLYNYTDEMAIDGIFIVLKPVGIM